MAKTIMSEEILLRPAEEADSNDVFLWRNDKASRGASFDTKEISWAEHQRWFSGSLLNSNRRVYIIMLKDGSKIGVLRFDIEAGSSVVSINISPKFRGLNYGKSALKKGCEVYFRENPSVQYLVAKVKPGNTASLKAFENAGFKRHGVGLDHIELILRGAE